jgi:hypothetical protein
MFTFGPNPTRAKKPGPLLLVYFMPLVHVQCRISSHLKKILNGAKSITKWVGKDVSWKNLKAKVSPHCFVRPIPSLHLYCIPTLTFSSVPTVHVHMGYFLYMNSVPQVPFCVLYLSFFYTFNSPGTLPLLYPYLTIFFRFVYLGYVLYTIHNIHNCFFFKIFFGGIFSFCSYNIQHCFICRPSDSTVLTDAGIEPRTVATCALAVRRSNH